MEVSQFPRPPRQTLTVTNSDLAFTQLLVATLHLTGASFLPCRILSRRAQRRRNPEQRGAQCRRCRRPHITRHAKPSRHQPTRGGGQIHVHILRAQSGRGRSHGRARVLFARTRCEQHLRRRAQRGIGRAARRRREWEAGNVRLRERGGADSVLDDRLAVRRHRPHRVVPRPRRRRGEACDGAGGETVQNSRRGLVRPLRLRPPLGRGFAARREAEPGHGGEDGGPRVGIAAGPAGEGRFRIHGVVPSCEGWALCWGIEARGVCRDQRQLVAVALEERGSSTVGNGKGAAAEEGPAAAAEGGLEVLDGNGQVRQAGCGGRRLWASPAVVDEAVPGRLEIGHRRERSLLGLAVRRPVHQRPGQELGRKFWTRDKLTVGVVFRERVRPRP